MALIERAMGVRDNGQPIPSEIDPDYARVIPPRLFEWRMSEAIRGKIAPQALRGMLNIRTTPDQSGRSDDDDLNAILAKVQPMTELERLTFLLEFKDVVAMASAGKRATWRTPGYATAAAVRARLGI